MLHGQFFHIESETVVNFLNVGILAGSVAVKLPQIIKILAVCENNPQHLSMSCVEQKRCGTIRELVRSGGMPRDATGSYMRE